jgi:hypothetical protein
LSIFADEAMPMTPFQRGLLMGVLLLLAGCGGVTDRMTLVVPRLDIDQQIAADFAAIFDDPDFTRIELVENPDQSLPGYHALISGQADLALVSNSEPYHPDLATVVPLYPTVLHIAYRSDEPIADIEDLFRGRTVFAGPPGSPSRRMLEAAAGREGAEAAGIRYADEAGVCADVMVVYAAILPDIPDRIGACGDYRLFSLGEPEALGTGSVVDSVALLNPMLKPFVIPRETYGDLNPDPVVTLAVDKLLVARADLPETAIYDLLREILRRKPALSARYPGLFHQLKDDFDVSGSAFVIHPGALAYLQRNEPDIYERYSGVAEVVVTLVIGLVSGAYAIFQILSIRRKNRIDAFCRRCIEIRDGALDGDAAARNEAVTSLKRLEDEAYELLIRERLSADESFRIFITLCNDAIADLEDRPRPGVA